MKMLNHLRIEAGYSITELAQMMGVENDVACRWLCGSAYPTPDETERLAAIFEVEPHSLQPLPSKEAGRSDKLRGKISTAGDRIRSGEAIHRRRVRS